MLGKFSYTEPCVFQPGSLETEAVCLAWLGLANCPVSASPMLGLYMCVTFDPRFLSWSFEFILAFSLS